MARFTYRTVTWGHLTDAMRSEGMNPLDVAALLDVNAERLQSWRDGAPVSTWFVIACAAMPPYFTDAPARISVSEFLRRHAWTPPTLARFTGVNPTTAKRWASGQNPEPHYIRTLLGLLETPGGLFRARAALSVLIEADSRRPGVAYPFAV